MLELQPHSVVADMGAADSAYVLPLARGFLVIDFPATWWLTPWTPKGVPKDRRGHGVGADIVIHEATAAGFEREHIVEK